MHFFYKLPCEFATLLCFNQKIDVFIFNIITWKILAKRIASITIDIIY